MSSQNEELGRGKDDEGKQPEFEQKDQEPEATRTALRPVEQVREVVALPAIKFDVNKPLSQTEVDALGEREVLEYGIEVGYESKRRAMSVIQFIRSHMRMLKKAKHDLSKPGRRTDLVPGCRTWKAYAENFPCSLRYLDKLLAESEMPYIDAKIIPLLTDGTESKAAEPQEGRTTEAATTNAEIADSGSATAVKNTVATPDTAKLRPELEDDPEQEATLAGQEDVPDSEEPDPDPAYDPHDIESIGLAINEDFKFQDDGFRREHAKVLVDRIEERFLQVILTEICRKTKQRVTGEPLTLPEIAHAWKSLFKAGDSNPRTLHNSLLKFAELLEPQFLDGLAKAVDSAIERKKKQERRVAKVGKKDKSQELSTH
jgi:hypothetical protein